MARLLIGPVFLLVVIALVLWFIRSGQKDRIRKTELTEARARLTRQQQAIDAIEHHAQEHLLIDPTNPLAVIVLDELDKALPKD